jgi:hypothetical protein
MNRRGLLGGLLATPLILRAPGFGRLIGSYGQSLRDREEQLFLAQQDLVVFDWFAALYLAPGSVNYVPLGQYRIGSVGEIVLL